MKYNIHNLVIDLFSEDMILHFKANFCPELTEVFMILM